MLDSIASDTSLIVVCPLLAVIVGRVLSRRTEAVRCGKNRIIRRLKAHKMERGNVIITIIAITHPRASIVVAPQQRHSDNPWCVCRGSAAQRGVAEAFARNYNATKAKTRRCVNGVKPLAMDGHCG